MTPKLSSDLVEKTADYSGDTFGGELFIAIQCLCSDVRTRLKKFAISSVYKDGVFSEPSVPAPCVRTPMLRIYLSRLVVFVPLLALTLASAEVKVRAPNPQTSGISVLQCVLQDPLQPIQCCEQVGPVSKVD